MPESQITGDLFLLSRESVNYAPNQTASPEARLVERIETGDAEAFNELYRRFAPMVHGIALSRVPRAEADDLVQEVFISVHKNLSSLRDRNAVGPWLAKIARNRALNYYRTVRPSDELTDEIAGSPSSKPEAFEILSVIRSMPDSYRETLVLRLVEGLTGPEIAAQTGMSVDSVRVNLHRGMKTLREKLGIEVKK